jgi:hypothetical protein
MSQFSQTVKAGSLLRTTEHLLMPEIEKAALWFADVYRQISKPRTVFTSTLNNTKIPIEAVSLYLNRINPDKLAFAAEHLRAAIIKIQNKYAGTENVSKGMVSAPQATDIPITILEKLSYIRENVESIKIWAESGKKAEEFFSTGHIPLHMLGDDLEALNKFSSSWNPTGFVGDLHMKREILNQGMVYCSLFVKVLAKNVSVKMRKRIDGAGDSITRKIGT